MSRVDRRNVILNVERTLPAAVLFARNPKVMGKVLGIVYRTHGHHSED